MPGYRLSARAIREVAKIITDLHRDVSSEIATSTENQLFSVFAEIGRFPGMGHTRTDLTSKKLLFHTSKPYMVAFRRKADRVEIVRVIHGSRNLPKLL